MAAVAHDPFALILADLLELREQLQAHLIELSEEDEPPPGAEWSARRLITMIDDYLEGSPVWGEELDGHIADVVAGGKYRVEKQGRDRAKDLRAHTLEVFGRWRLLLRDRPPSHPAADAPLGEKLMWELEEASRRFADHDASREEARAERNRLIHRLYYEFGDRYKVHDLARVVGVVDERIRQIAHEVDQQIGGGGD